MPNSNYKIFPLGDSALTVEFGNVISPALNRKAISLADALEHARFPGFTETVSAYASTTVFYDPFEVRRSFPEFATAFDAVRQIATDTAAALGESTGEVSRIIEVPVIFDRENEYDLAHVASEHSLSIDEVIDIFTSTTYRVYMLGFLPGFSYMGEVDERIATPRKETPRTAVPKGSVGIAGRQTGIYSLASPGGWQIIGRTELEMFDPRAETPAFLRASDLVRFVEA